MKLRVLGTLEISKDDGSPIVVSSPAQRRLLAALSVHRGSVVSSGRLEDMLGLSNSGLRSLVSRLRSSIGSDVLITKPPGYALVGVTLDSDEFEELLLTAQSLEPRHALTTLDQAIAAWHGEPYAEFSSEEWVRPETVRLLELRATAIEERAEALLRLGRSGEAVALLEWHVARYPLRDRPRGQLMRALAQDGREAEALRSFQAYRDFLAEETGLEPSQEVQSIDQAIATGQHLEQPGRRAGLGPKPAVRSEPGNLVPRLSSFVGREVELETIANQLADQRLITLKGVGGVGKTRLAEEVARQVARRFPGGVWICEFDSVKDGESVAHVVAQTLGIRLQAGVPRVEAIVAALSGWSPFLLVLDNCEHLIETIGYLVEAITSDCPNATVLATSREPLRVQGEHVHLLEPLDPASEGVDLFVDRARSLGSTLLPGTSDTTIEKLCARLDGLPLAIELSAARSGAMTVEELIAHLDRRFQILQDGALGVPRHETLWATVQWSFDLLDEEDKLLFHRLAVFAGGFDLNAVQTVCATDPLDTGSAIRSLLRLVDKSMVTAQATQMGTRYRLLETLRMFARVTAEGSGEYGHLRRAHLEYYTDLSKRAGELTLRDRWPEGRRMFQTEWDNIREAVRTAAEIVDISSAERILSAGAFYSTFAVRHELGSWAEEVLGLEGSNPIPAGVYYAAGLGRFLLGDYAGAIEILEQGLRAPGDTESWAACRVQAAWSSHMAGLGDKAWDLLRALDDPPLPPAWIQSAQQALYVFSVHSGKLTLAEGRGHLERARRLGMSLQNPALESAFWYMDALLSYDEGNHERFSRAISNSHEIARDAGVTLLANMALTSLTFRGRHREAMRAARAALEHAQTTGDWAVGWIALEGLGIRLAEGGDSEGAGVILGYLERLGIGNVSYSSRRMAALDAITSQPEGQDGMSRSEVLTKSDVVEFALQRTPVRARAP